MSFESDDVNASRLVRKNLYRPEVFDGRTASPTAAGRCSRTSATTHATAPAVCDAAAYDYDNGAIDTIPAYCVIREWHKRERAERSLAASRRDRLREPAAAAGAAIDHRTSTSSPAARAYTSRRVAPRRRATLRSAADNAVDLSGCGLGSGPDIRRPAVSWDAQDDRLRARARPRATLSRSTR